MSDEFTLRFFVGDANGRRSGAWRIWTHGNDIYVAPREVAGDLKFSLHESGECINAYTQALESELGGAGDFPTGNRRVHTWWCDRGPEIRNAIALRLSFPADELRPIGADAVLDKPHVAIPAPPSGHEAVVYISFTRTGPITITDPEFGLLADYPLPDGSRLAILHRVLPVPQDLVEAIARRRADKPSIWMLMPKGAPFRPHDHGNRILIPGMYGEDGFATYAEVALLGAAT